ncbi:MAG: FAD-dependent oxidoreductase [Pseudopedobacter saltans]|uniref:FAD-dependent oxidoreductase n=1 Tax=Pseudopedobacter saltans TaxID=151895 RepID=A0A2W5F1J8_9SPHI|nr:MAG: FAD-dependent oxidoreductase [Pseudopedobacter saltans]
MHVDYLIVGQGISGTFLSYYLRSAGKSVLVIDKPLSNTASRIASGVINPVTGRRIVTTWMIDELLPFAKKAYQEIGKLLGESIVDECSILEFHPTLQMQEAFNTRLAESADYLSSVNNEQNWEPIFNYHFGIGKVSPALHLDLQTLLNGYRSFLQKENLLFEDVLEEQYLTIKDDSVQYKDIVASKIFFCDGVAGILHPYFDKLPFAFNKGEAIIAEIPDLPNQYIYKQGLSLVPWDKEKQLFWIGSTYTWKYDDVLPTKDFSEKVKFQLDNWLKLPYKIVDHFAAERPANVERRPFVGLHPQFPNIGILNGMGTKGCSLAPFFAKEIVDLLLSGKPINPLADVGRFARVLAR